VICWRKRGLFRTSLKFTACWIVSLFSSYLFVEEGELENFSPSLFAILSAELDTKFRSDANVL